METNPSENHKNVAALVHLSTFSKYFFPFGNFLGPLILWTVNKEKPFVNEHGRQALNFQLSILLYAIVITIITIPFFAIFATDFVDLVEAIDRHSHHVSFQNIKNFSGYMTLFFVVAIILFGVFVFELYAVINATVHANRGKLYNYPLSIPFIKLATEPPVNEGETEQNQSNNEHAS
ncbi:MAG: DUF4870 domain-containing protein [Bacteroidota bacterium]